MKKQFFRVKQLADQTFSRAGKTEVLSDDLQEADRKVEYIRTACQNTSKKLASSLIGQGLGHDAAAKEKKLKKIPEYVLGLAMQDAGTTDEDCLLRTVLTECGRVEVELANETMAHDTRVEEQVVNKLHGMLDPEVNNILKHKRNLAKLILDMDSAKTRHLTAVKHSGGASTGTSRAESIKEELEDAELKVEQCRDHLASEMFQLLSREADLANVVVQYVKLQRVYHESALKLLEKVIPDLETSIDESSSKPVYGYPLEDHLRITGRKIAFPIELCVCALLELGMEEEGLFRVAGGSSKLRRIKMSFDACCLTLPTALEYRDPHVIAGALKSYLRDLPEPLMTHGLYDEWMAAARVQTSNDARLQALWQVVHKLPQANYDNLRYLVKFLAALSRNQEVNKMTPQNIAIVIAPNLIWSREDEGNMGMNMNSANMYSFIVDNLVTFSDWFFPGELDFYQTLCRESGMVNGLMAASFSSLSGQLSSEAGGGSPVDKGLRHTRSSSGEGALIATGGDMKRTQSNSSLSDHSSPPQGSPKPATRRKNKPAPVPPANSATARDPPSLFTPPDKNVEKPDKTVEKLERPADKPDKPPRPAGAPPITSSTLPRPSKKVSDASLHDVRTVAPSHVVESMPHAPAEKQQKSYGGTPIGFEPFVAPKKTSDGSDHYHNHHHPQQQLVTISTSHQKLPEKVSIGSVVRSVEETTTTLTPSVVEHPHPPPPHVTSAAAKSLGADHLNKSFGYSSSTLDRKHTGGHRPIPVAAPRSVVNVTVPTCGDSSCKDPQEQMSDDGGKLEGEAPKEEDTAGSTEEVVTLRRPHHHSEGGERLNKPAIPERPATLLRPHNSFRGSRHSGDSLNSDSGDRNSSDSERPMLERTHIYSVDKQQVSIIQVGEKSGAGTGAREAGGGVVGGLVRSPSVGARPLSMTLPEKGASVEKPERPPRPDVLPATERTQSSHSRTRSEGNICDVSTTENSALRSPHRPTSPPAPYRPPRPQPPPPPPPGKMAGRHREPTWESTDL